MGRPIADVLRELAGGATYDELNAALADVVAKVQETGKVGELALKLKIKPSGDGTTVTVTDEIKAKAPEPTRPTTIFFATVDGALLRSDPRQREMPLREVPGATAKEAV